LQGSGPCLPPLVPALIMTTNITAIAEEMVNIKVQNTYSLLSYILLLNTIISIESQDIYHIGVGEGGNKSQEADLF
jgi:hypothetical protein